MGVSNLDSLTLADDLVVDGATTVAETLAITGVTTATGGVVGDVTGDVTGEVNALGSAVTAEHGTGAVGTGGSVTTYRYNLPNGDICTEIQVDITGLGVKGTAANDVIGVVTDAPDAYIGEYDTAKYGIVYRVEAICLEVPAGSETITVDINLAGNSSALGYDEAAGAAECDFGGMAAGCSYVDDAPALTADDYLYLVEGDTAATTGVYSAGQFIFRFYGHALLS